MSDEGLDLSQRISESLFAGPELDADSEEIIMGKWNGQPVTMVTSNHGDRHKGGQGHCSGDIFIIWLVS